MLPTLIAYPAMATLHNHCIRLRVKANATFFSRKTHAYSRFEMTSITDILRSVFRLIPEILTHHSTLMMSWRIFLFCIWVKVYINLLHVVIRIQLFPVSVLRISWCLFELKKVIKFLRFFSIDFLKFRKLTNMLFIEQRLGLVPLMFLLDIR